MGRAGSTQQNRADRDTVATDHFEHVEQDVGRIQVGANQDIGLALKAAARQDTVCLLYTSPSPRDRQKSRMPSSA